MKSRRTSRDWRRAVLRDPAISDATRVLLLVLAEHMRANLHVSVPRKDLARWLNRSEKRITERIRNAHDAGFLDTVSPGYKGHTAVYVGLFPDAQRVPLDGTLCEPQRETPTRALYESAKQDPLRPYSGTPGGPTTSKPTTHSRPVADLPEELRVFGLPGEYPIADPPAVDRVPDEGEEEEQRSA